MDEAAATVDHDPAGQLEHEELPMTAEYDPAAHALQAAAEEAPEFDDHVPALHS